MGWVRALVGTRLPERYRRFLDLPSRQASFRYADTRGSALGAVASAWEVRFGDESGVYRLLSGREALSARLALIDAAQQSVDIQSYLIRYDISGNLIAQRLVAAARRGVRVRLLMDDALTIGSDDGLTALDGQGGIEVRVFNPFPRHRSRLLSFILNFNLLNRRMHNKSFTVDNGITIVGGRNIADEYYQTSVDAEFVDEDLLATGRVVDAVSRSFDEYWNAREACPVGFLRPPHDGGQQDRLAAAAKSILEQPRARDYVNSLDLSFADRIVAGELPFVPGRASLVYDKPEKIRGLTRKRAGRTSRHLQQLVSGAADDVLIVSPYFVPRREGVDFLAALVRKGVRVRVVTNSLASTNHASVHAAYARYRKPLLRQGIELYELSPRLPAGVSLPGRTTRLTLHSKVAVVDARDVFVGSFNLDPRSLFINTEMGLSVADCEELAAPAAAAILRALPETAFKLRLGRRGRLRWTIVTDAGNVTYRSEPETGWLRRLRTRAMGFLPIESQM